MVSRHMHSQVAIDNMSILLYSKWKYLNNGMEWNEAMNAKRTSIYTTQNQRKLNNTSKL